MKIALVVAVIAAIIFAVLYFMTLHNMELLQGRQADQALPGNVNTAYV